MQLPRIKIVMRLGPGSYGTIQYTLFELGTFGNALRELPGHGQFDCRRSFRIEMSGRNPRETIREKKARAIISNFGKTVHLTGYGLYYRLILPV